jgi:regulatory factor X, other
LVVPKFDFWISWNVDGSRSTRPQLTRSRTLGPKSGFCNVQSTLPFIHYLCQEITRILSPLALQVVPPTILNSLRSLSNTLPDHIQTTFSNHAQHLLRAKLVPATAFARLLTRLIRVNDTAHAAARFLANPADRELMRSDWLRFVSPKTIVQRELPCGEVLAESILRDEVVNLLSPETKFSNGGQNGDSPTTRNRPDNTPPPRKRPRTDVGPPTFASFEATTTTAEPLLDPMTMVEQLPPSDQTSMTQGVLDRWAMWLCKLPERFPQVPPRVFLWCMESVGAGALRDITVAGGEGFGAWWVVRCWMDEWMGWIAEKGGFLDMDSDTELTGNIIHNNNSGNNRVGGLLGDTLTY